MGSDDGNPSPPLQACSLLSPTTVTGGLSCVIGFTVRTVRRVTDDEDVVAAPRGCTSENGVGVTRVDLVLTLAAPLGTGFAPGTLPWVVLTERDRSFGAGAAAVLIFFSVSPLRGIKSRSVLLSTK